LLLVENLGVERDTDADAGVVFHPGNLVLVRVDLAVLTAVGFALDDEAAVTSGNELLEDGGKFLGYLFKRTLYRFILRLIEMFDKLLD
jgi:hypothetical protein